MTESGRVRRLVLLLLAVVCGLCDMGAEIVEASDDLLVADFEGETYGEWQVTGEAFGSGPARGALPGQMSVDGFAGVGLVNSFVGGDDATGTLTSPVFRIERGYLSFLIGGGRSDQLALQLLVDGEPVVQNEIELADGAVDWWAPLDISGWRDREVTLRVDRLHEDSAALQNVGESDELRDAAELYGEPLRGQFHFSPRRGWNNDPNGCVYYNGEYHLFFQHNPYGWSWGNMHWGHAVSRDLVHWEELGDVLQPDELGPMFSGSAVVDWNNTSGFGADGRPPLVLIYTAAGSPTVQCLAYSTDGRKFVKYAGNPVLGEVTGGNRDPKVFWHADTRQWVMVLYVEQRGRHTVHFCVSPNLRDWKLASVTEGDAVGGRYLFECPDLFELSVDGEAARRKWVLLAANGEYGVGG
ncbi:MAG: hypothetical protein ACK5MS_04860, partial [Planctomyces sp.]